MDIMLHMGRDGRFALTCDGVFKTMIEQVEMDSAENHLAIRFAGTAEPVLLNCPIDFEIKAAMMNQTTCPIGFFLGRRLAMAIEVPFRAH